MAKYVGKRLLYAAMTVFLLIALTFFMMQLLPGDPFIGEKAIPEVTMNALKAKYGLDKPLLQQFVTYVGNVLKGDLGISIHYNRAVTKIISETFPYSFELGVRALIFAICAGVGLGILAAVRRGTGWDTFGMTLAVVGISIPSFVVASFLQYFFSLKLRQWFGIHLFPVTGWTTVWHKILPSFALSFGTMATLSRLMRTSMLDVMSQDYIKTAKAKGLSQRKIIWRHAVRNAIMPVITVLGPITAGVLTGAFVIESVFSIPGMGRFFVLSIQVLDYTMIAGTTLFYGVFLVIATLVVDIAYGFIDPRVKLAK